MERNMIIQDEMFEIATSLLSNRFSQDEGYVAVLRLETGEYLTSVWVEAVCSSADLCAETGAICEAHKLNKKVTHSMCISKPKHFKNIEDYEILSPCGICQERLRFWGKEVLVAITAKGKNIVFKTLEEMQPFYWNNK